MSQLVTDHELKIYGFLYKILWHVDAYMPLTKATKDELKLLPELKEKGLVNFNNEAVWLTLDGYMFMERIEKRVPNILKELGLEERTKHYGSKSGSS